MSKIDTRAGAMEELGMSEAQAFSAGYEAGERDGRSAIAAERDALRAEVERLKKERLADLTRLNEDAKAMDLATSAIHSLRATVAALKGGAA